MAEKPHSIPPAINTNFPVRMIGFTFWFTTQPNKILDNYHKKGKGHIKTFLYSIHNPAENNEQKRFNEELASFYKAIHRNSEVISGQEVKAKTGIRSKMFSDVIGTNGFDNLNVKSKDILFLIKSIKFRVLLTYFNHSNHTTWRSFNSTRYPHMLDNFICSLLLFRRV